LLEHFKQLRRAEWLQTEWPELVKGAREQKALLLFGDEASFAQEGSLSYTWAWRGHQPVVAIRGIRKAYKVFGLLDYFTGHLFYSGHTARFNAASYCEFLKKVLGQIPSTQKIMVVQDGARYHTARATKEFIAAHASRLSVYQLPAYSPDYNPIEHLWRRIKRKASHNRYFENFEDLIASVETALAELAAKPEEVLALAGTILDKWAA
jgi:transposase